MQFKTDNDIINMSTPINKDFKSMGNTNTQTIISSIQNDQLIEALTAAMKTQIELGDSSFSRFNQAIDQIIKDKIKPILTEAKGKMSSSTSVSGLKEHFCRGRKWITIPKDHELYETAINKANENGLENLVGLWESRGFAWVRFHSTKGLMANFSIHSNSSVGSNIKFSVNQDTAMEMEILNGTPKSMGYEEKTLPQKTEVIETEETNETEESETVIEETESIQQNEESPNEEIDIDSLESDLDGESDDLDNI